MKIGISSWACPWAVGVPGYPKPAKPLGAMALLELATEVKAEALQVADNLPLHALSMPELRDLAAAAKDHAVELEAGTKGLEPGNLLRYLEIAGALGAKLVRTLPHDGNDRPDLSEALRRLKAVSRAYEAAGVTLAIENHDHYPSRWLARLVEEAGSPAVGVCLDAVNNLGLGESFREVLGNLGGLTVNFHCKDYRIARKPTMLGFDVTGCPAGSGMLDLNHARNALRRDISWIIESWTPWQGDIASTASMERLWLDEGMANLIEFRDGARPVIAIRSYWP
jgi:sugar phosphate isomerase/epimerase